VGPRPGTSQALETAPLVRPRAHTNSWVRVPTGGEADPFVAEGNCVAERRGGEQLEANNQPVNTSMLNSIRFQSSASLLAKGEAREPVLVAPLKGREQGQADPPHQQRKGREGELWDGWRQDGWKLE
jgi:hypothetical protein